MISSPLTKAYQKHYLWITRYFYGEWYFMWSWVLSEILLERAFSALYLLSLPLFGNTWLTCQIVIFCESLWRDCNSPAKLTVKVFFVYHAVISICWRGLLDWMFLDKSIVKLSTFLKNIWSGVFQLIELVIAAFWARHAILECCVTVLNRVCVGGG